MYNKSKKYKNIVFDVGHVLLSYRWKNLMIEYGMKPEEAEDFYKLTCGDPLWEEFDYENISYEEVIDTFIKKNPTLKNEIHYFFNNKEHMAVARPEVYKKCNQLLKKGYKLYILSNYSSVLFETHTKKIPILESFSGILVSYMIHRIKPDHKIYEELYTRFNINPEESLFFDDRTENIQASIETGMDGILVESEDALIIELNNLIQ